ncbi:MAG: DUF1674 domain-containing protein [Rhodothalassiaceae bacterium]
MSQRKRSPHEPQDQGNNPAPDQPKPQEVGGRDGPEPTRYGDWEVGSLCTDF